MKYAQKRTNTSHLVSIIIPAYLAEITIKNTIQSVLNQTYDNLEIVIVSDDGCDYEKIIGIHDHRLHFLSTGKIGGGPSYARNVGFKHSTGSLVTFLDSDDLYRPTRIAELVPYAIEFGAACDNIVSVDYQSKSELSFAFENWLQKTHEMTILDFQDIMDINSPIFPVYQRKFIGSWMEEIRFAEDVIFNVSCCIKAKRMAILNKSLMEYSVRQGSLSNSANNHITAMNAYVAIIENIDKGRMTSIKSPLMRQKIRAMFMRKQKLNERYGHFIENIKEISFAEFQRIA